MTTNEFYKWREIKKWHRCETDKYERALRYGKITTNEVATPMDKTTATKIQSGSSMAIPNDDDEVEVTRNGIRKKSES
eukprot:CAMPEP_0185725976 /NCGR_PEP_ID=MMETSP1171-20130828/2095_1 /TAXON_ID=374046 /ORGANISM="Helicotheca tamensis, Strain CCMP826" /LENGTH=77 /DNA_ID=CAMNT_0028394231 /DNA_START=81 /DNA_END=310 /DNA_ORIENTATION=-